MRCVICSRRIWRGVTGWGGEGRAPRAQARRLPRDLPLPARRGSRSSLPLSWSAIAGLHIVEVTSRVTNTTETFPAVVDLRPACSTIDRHFAGSARCRKVDCAGVRCLREQRAHREWSYRKHTTDAPRQPSSATSGPCPFEPVTIDWFHGLRGGSVRSHPTREHSLLTARRRDGSRHPVGAKRREWSVRHAYAPGNTWSVRATDRSDT